MKAVLDGVAHATVRERFTINLLSDGKIRPTAVSVYTDLILWYNNLGQKIVRSRFYRIKMRCCSRNSSRTFLLTQ